MKWQVKPKAPASFLKRFPEYSPLIRQLLYNRGLKTQKQVDEFFNPDFLEDFHNPFLLKGMRKAVKRILQAIEREEKILIYGDFDADGICATAILFLTFRGLGVKNLDAYIPDREKEGHGLTEQVVRDLARENVKLIITVDCGSVDLEEVDLANSLGLEVIITDHHQSRKKLPQAVALINPKRRDESYPFKDLAGAAIAYKLAWALLSAKETDSLNPLKKWLLDLVALATVADVEPIIGENRTLIKYGLGVLAQTKWLGLKELMEIAKLNPQIIEPSSEGRAPSTNLDTYTLGYILGPRLNAAGRMDHANTAFRLLVTEDKRTAERLARQINQNNLDRQNLTDRVIREIENRLADMINQNKLPKIIFEGSPDWPVGIVGLVAAKIADRYYRPAVIYQEKGDLILASCRSIPQFDLMELLEKHARYFDDFGGRPATGGFQMKKERLEEAKKSFNQMAEKKLKDLELVPKLEIDTQLNLEDINWSNYDQIQLFAPFGKANPQPRFLVEGLEVKDVRIVGNNGKHLKMELMIFDSQSIRGKIFKAIGFNLSQWQEKLKVGDAIDMVFELIADEWNGYRDLQLKIVDLKMAGI
jgi:single-stranded-DNA-specific exonuclease